jgi:Na+-transporting NADH:ubiquinone oxidoreductase subunit NqrF
VDRDSFGIYPDSFHIFLKNCSVDLVKEMHGKIFFVQLSDSESSMNLSTMYQSRSYRNLPYQDSFDNLSLLQLAHQTE